MWIKQILYNGSKNLKTVDYIGYYFFFCGCMRLSRSIYFTYNQNVVHGYLYTLKEKSNIICFHTEFVEKVAIGCTVNIKHLGLALSKGNKIPPTSTCRVRCYVSFVESILNYYSVFQQGGYIRK